MAKGHVSPNPMVGAVLVHNERIIGEGWHQQYGQAHAEVNCLASVADEDRQYIPESSMYVSLEPCSHFGKTPPCANRLVKEGIKNVVICNKDPFAQVNGRGVEILQSNGISVTTGVLADAGRWVNRRFFCLHEQQRPYIILKWAQTADGFIAPTDRSRYPITNAQSNQLVHKWRTEEDAIMVGFQTALNDNPQLTARLWDGKNPLRIVTDKNLTLPSSLKLFDNGAETWVLNSKEENSKGNLHHIQLDFNSSIIPQLLQRLYESNKQSLIVEGGAVLLQTFIDAGLWDEARVFTGPAKLEAGIKSPVLQQADMVMQSHISTDTLQVYTNTATPYPYVNGYDL